MALIDKASLLMVPSVYEDGTLYNVLPSGNKAPDETGNHNGYDQTRADFSFSRDGSGASPATRVNSAGIIEKGRTNLLLQSNQFDTTWSGAVTTTSGQSGYDGTNNAWLIENTASSAYIRQTNTTSGVLTASIYAKAGNVNWMRFAVSNSPIVSIYFDLVNGVGYGASNLISHDIEDVGNGWHRYSVSFLANSMSGMQWYPADGNNDLGEVGDNILIQNAQLEKGLISTNYIATTTAAASAGILGDMPRLDYSGGATSLLLEPNRRNLIPYSEYFGTSDWVKLGIGTGSTPIITHNYNISPDGSRNATRIQLDLNGGTTSGDQSLIYDDLGVKSGDHTRSIYIKSNTSDVDLYFGGTLTDNKIITATTQWQRFDFKSTLSSATLFATIGLRGTTGSSDNADISIWGFQAEAGSYPTSYIPTHGSSTARGGDDMNDSTFTALPNANLTIFFEVGDWAGSEGNNYQLRFIDSSGNRQIQFRNRPEGWRWLVVNDAGSAAYLHTANYTYRKMAVRYNGTNYQLFANGSAVGSAFAANDAGVLDTFQSFSIGVMGVKQMLCFPTALTDAECIALTT